MLKKEQKEALQLLIRLYADEVARASVGEVSNPAEQAEAINLFLDEITVPEGWQMVPVKPTEAILDVLYDSGIDEHDEYLRDVYRAMLAAAPKPGDSSAPEKSRSQRLRARSTDRRTPIDMILNCPACGLQHIDAPDERTPDWKNEPHRSHLCHGCGHIWRPADVPTNGVAAIKTKGKADSPIDPRPVAIESLAQRVPLSDEQIYQVIEAARESYRAHTTGIRGQMLTIYDDMDWHLVRAVEQAHGITPRRTEP